MKKKTKSKDEIVLEIKDIVASFSHKEPYISNTVKRIEWLIDDYFTAPKESV